MKLIVEPDAGNRPILEAIARARTAVDLLIFRLDGHTLTRTLEAAIARGVAVRVLIAHKNRGGKKNLRKLEWRLLEAGATVSRTADDLVRYHGKMLIVDNRVLHVYGFNCTWIDLKSRSFGVVTSHRRLVAEALKLFEADSTRRRYTADYRNFVVSPDNSRERLWSFIRGARRELLVYDPRLSDPMMHHALIERSRRGVDVRIVGRLVGLRSELAIRDAPLRLHVRAIIRDGETAFVGSQSLARVALDDRREIGVIIRESGVVRQMRAVFEQDWVPVARCACG